jgi:hypothetical protein
VAIAVPWWIARRNDIRLELASGAGGLVLQLLGAGMLLVGVALFVWSVYNFATRGRGTLAPWDPPRALVVSGPYRFVRSDHSGRSSRFGSGSQNEAMKPMR